MSPDDARALLELSCQVRWDFPTSSGRPVRGEPAGPVARLVEVRPRLADAVAALEPGAATELAARCWRLWVLARDVTGGRAFLAPVVDGPATRWRSLARYGDGLLAFWAGDVAASRARSEAALADAGTDPEALALGHLGVARAAVSDGDAVKATEHALAARAAARDLGEPFAQAPLHMHAQARLLARDLDGAAALFEESLALNRRLDDAGMVVCELHNLGFVQVRRGEADAAERLFEECQRLAPASDPFAKAFGELNRGAVAFVRRDPGTARLKLAAAEAMLREAGLDPDGESDVRWLRDELQR
jgi:tetratricopeptide (TPR) repeat protein